MIKKAVLDKFGSTKDRLKEIFTAQMPQEPHGLDESQVKKINRDIACREKMEGIIRQRINEGITQCLKRNSLWEAVDLAWDWTPISGVSLPLLQLAQGKINMESCVTELQKLPNAAKYLRKDGEKMQLDLPTFIEVEANLIRSFVTRRVAAQANKYNNLWPYYKYESRSTGQVGKLRADLMSQRADIMADQFGWRHHDTQLYRDMFLYSHSMDFVRSAWEVDYGYKIAEEEVSAPVLDERIDEPSVGEVSPLEAPPAPVIEQAMESTPPKGVERYVQREGISFFNPHPSRVWWDNNHAPASINSDSGCEFLMFWDVIRLKDVKENPCFWKRDEFSYMPETVELFATYQSYFSNSNITVMNPVASQAGLPLSSTAGNDRKNNVGLYSEGQNDASIFKTEFFWKLRPVDYGIGNYPEPVWVRFIVASDSTVVYAEFMPSTPAAYLGYNENDSRQTNLSFAHELMGYQDQMKNLLKQLVLLAEQEAFKVFMVNTDMVPDQQQREKIKARLEGRGWAGRPLVVEYSFEDLKELEIDLTPVKVTGTDVSGSMSAIIRTMAELIALVEKMASMSPAEQGQPAPREISATEVNEMSTTTQSVYTFISDAIDEMHAAKKRIVYESTVCCQESKIKLPVSARYTKETIRLAKLDVDEDENEPEVNKSKRFTAVIGADDLVHDYIFSTRDGAERPVNTAAASTLVTMLSQLIAIPNILQAFGKERVYMIINEIFRMSGTGVDVNLEKAEGEDDAFASDEMQQLQGILQQLTEQVKLIAEKVQQHDEAISHMAELALEVKRMAQPAATA